MCQSLIPVRFQDRHESLGIRIGKWAEHDGVQQREHARDRAHPDAKGDYRGECVHRHRSQRASGVPQVLERIFNRAMTEFVAHDLPASILLHRS